MKRVKTPFLAIIAICSLACKDGKKATTESSSAEAKVENQTQQMARVTFKDESSSALFKDYQKLRKALVATAKDKAKIAAEEMKMNLGDNQKEISFLTEELSQAEDVEKQRELFSEISQKVEPLFKGTLESGEMYKQFCPMAFEGKGGYWISDASEIRNPYFGNKMLTCGKVTETIK